MNFPEAPISGLVLIDKPHGISSFQVIRELRKRLGIKKAGHAGTLDPFATGLLVCALGTATKTLTYLQGGGKIYTGTMALGISSDTDDITGRCVSSAVPHTLTLEDVQAVARRFEGPIWQVPPAVSALHVDGERAYDLVRRGEEVSLPPRQVVVELFQVFELVRDGDGTVRASFEVRCSKGTYIRALARDVGAALKVGGCLATLRRTASAPFDVRAGLRLEEVSLQSVIPWYVAFGGALSVDTTAKEQERLSHGCQQTFGRIVERLAGLPGEPDDGFLLRVTGQAKPFGLIRKVGGSLTLALSFR